MSPRFDETRAIAHLPSLDIEIVHRRAEDASAEEIAVRLTATPSFEVVGRAFEAANPFLFWSKMIEMAWAPWLKAFSPPLLENKDKPR